ncbi:hypothetical protein MKW98_018210 [Papaver atlanticum]|uniref:Uncharacterized protein n=1 Tax=Papaver atlanticum TaxID=357466 RepID=A0AAD4RV65_9MAGN|nr:hypothetical protein MKW98_018210 [Papaver atlanticum]
MAFKPEENLSDTHCTLFQPVFLSSNSNRVLKLRHVNTGYYVRFFYGSGHYDGCLSLSLNYDNDVCTFIDWNSVVVLPDLIRILGDDNGNHLKALDGDGYMDYVHKADNSSRFVYEVSPNNSEWVLLKHASPTVHDTNTVFIPIILDGNYRLDRADKVSCLATLANYPDYWSSKDIEEPVISRKIENVRYHLTDAKLYNEKSVALITDDSSNRTQHPLTSQLNLKTTVSNTTNWSTSVPLKVGVKMIGTLGVPLISLGSLEISAEGAKSWNWGEMKTESLEVGSVRTVTVPPMSRVKVSLMATRLSYDIPFSYTQYDVLKDGSTKVSEKNDGVFTRNNGYGYRYEAAPLPLE